MDPVSIGGRSGRNVVPNARNSGNNSDEWNGYQLQIPLDEIFDCDSAPECCRTCYYKNKGMSKKKKFAITFVIYTASIILTALIVRFSLGPIDVILGVGNQRPIIDQDTNFSPLLCSKYSLTNIPMVQNPVPTATDSPISDSLSSSLSSRSSQTDASSSSLDESQDNPVFDAYMLLDTPYRNYRTATYEKQEMLSFPTENYFNYWAFYLGSGSKVTVSMCPGPNTFIDVNFLRGKDALDEVLKSRELGDAEVVQTYTFYPCASSSDPPSTHFTTYSDSDYAFVFTVSLFHGDLGPGSNFSIPASFSISHKELEYGRGSLYARCEDVSRCTLPMPNKAKSLLLEMKQNATRWPMTIRAECVPSIGMYFAFFLGVPVGFMLFLASCGGILYLCQKSVMRDIELADNQRRARTTSPMTISSASQRPTSETMSRATVNRRAFRTTTSPRTPLVDHDVLAAMAEVSRQHDLPPTYNEINHVSSPVGEQPPANFNAPHDQPDNAPPSYNSIVI